MSNYHIYIKILLSAKTLKSTNPSLEVLCLFFQKVSPHTNQKGLVQKVFP